MALLKDFEQIIDNGLTKNTITMLKGVPAAGKTILAVTLAAELLESGKKCLYITTELPPTEVLENAEIIGKDLSNYVVKGALRFADAYSWRLDVRGDNVINLPDLGQFGHVIKEMMDSQGKGCVVIFDTLTGLMVYHEPEHVIKFMQIQVARFRQNGSFTLIIIETGAVDRNVMRMLTLGVDALVEIKLREERGYLRRYLRVFSAKKAKHRTEWIPFDVTSKGFALRMEGLKKEI